MKNNSVRKLTTMAMLSAIAYLVMLVIHINVVPGVAFLTYDPKDVIIAIAGFLFDPLAALLATAVVALVEMVTVSSSGLIGCLMNFISTAAFACTAALVYKKKRTLSGAVLGLALGSIAAVILMLLWNWLITPIYMEVPRPAVVQMLIPVFLPFNALKCGLNMAFTLLLYKPLTTGLYRSGLLSRRSAPQAAPGRLWLWLGAGALLIGCILAALLWNGVI